MGCNDQEYDISIKRGDTFTRRYHVSKNGVDVDLTGYSLSSDIRKPNGDLVAALSIVAIDLAHGRFDIAPIATDNWPLGVLLWDVKMVNALDEITHSITRKVLIEASITE